MFILSMLPPPEEKLTDDKSGIIFLKIYCSSENRKSSHFQEYHSLIVNCVIQLKKCVLQCSMCSKLTAKAPNCSQSWGSCPEMFHEKYVSKKFKKFTVKHLFRSLFFNEIACWSLSTLLKRDFRLLFFQRVLWYF